MYLFFSVNCSLCAGVATKAIGVTAPKRPLKEALHQSNPSPTRDEKELGPGFPRQTHHSSHT